MQSQQLPRAQTGKRDNVEAAELIRRACREQLLLWSDLDALVGDQNDGTIEGVCAWYRCSDPRVQGV